MSLIRPSVSIFWQLQAVGWTGFFLAMSLSRLGSHPFGYMVSAKGLLTVLGIAASLALRPLLRRRIAEDSSMPVLVAACVLAAYVLGAAWAAAVNVLVQPLDAALLGDHDSIESLGDLMSGTVQAAFILVAWGFLYIGIKNNLALQRERERALRAETLATRARLDALQSRLNPHFLFNTLNAISTLVVERRVARAAAMIAGLSELLRTTLRQEPSTSVTLADELAVVRQYLEIEQARFEERLTVRFDVDAESHLACVPLLIIQPLVENAVRHGIAPVAAGGVVSVAARRRDTWLEIGVTNTGPARPRADTAGHGVGLANLRERLAVLYPHRHEVLARPLPGGGFEVRIRLPYRAAGMPPDSSPGEPDAVVGRESTAELLTVRDP